MSEDIGIQIIDTSNGTNQARSLGIVYYLGLDFGTFTYPPPMLKEGVLLEILACVTILNTKMHYHIGIYFLSVVSQLEKYGPYINWTVDY